MELFDKELQEYLDQRE